MRAPRLGAAALATLLVAGCGEPPPPAPLAEPSLGPLDALARRFGRLRRRMRERGYGHATRLERTFLLDGQGVAFPVDLPTGRCTTWLALAGGGLRDLRGSIYDGEGYEIAADDVRGEGALLHVCPAPEEARPSAPHYVELRSLEGSGAVVLGAFESEPGAGAGFEQLFDGVVAPPVPFREVEDALVEVREGLRERGLVVEGEPFFRRVAEGQGLRRPLSLAADRCYVVVARGGDGLEDLDLYLYDRRGAEVARDLGADARPRIEYCPQVAQQATLELRAFQGAGAVGVMVLSGAPQEPTPPPTEEVADAEPLALLGGQLEEFVARGFGPPLTIVQDAALNPGETRTHEVGVGPGCALVVGAGGGGEVDLDLYLVDPDGALADRDTRVQHTARVVACADAPAVYRVTVKAYGRGRYALARLPATSLTDVAEVRLAAAAPRELSEAPDAHTARRTLDEGERAGVVLPPGRCAEAAVGGSASVADVDLVLRDEAGEPVASDTGPAPWATVAYCAEEDAPASGLTLETSLYRGSGEVLLRWRVY